MEGGEAERRLWEGEWWDLCLKRKGFIVGCGGASGEGLGSGAAEAMASA